jgi:protein gp37
MGEHTEIAWTDATWNAWIGCTAVSAGCRECYAERDARRYGKAGHFGAGRARHVCSAAHWRLPLTWAKKAEKAGTRPRVFCGSMMDVFDAEVPQIHRERVWETIAATPALDWLLLTKRPELAAGMVPAAWLAGGWPAHVWLGATVEDGSTAARIGHLAALPAPVRFLSVEPMLGPLRVPAWLQSGAIHWIICGGESGPRARALHPQWARELRDDCREAGVPFFFKQWGEWIESSDPMMPWHAPIGHTEMEARNDAYRRARGMSDDELMRNGCVRVARVGVKAAGEVLDGARYRMMPGEVW